MRRTTTSILAFALAVTLAPSALHANGSYSHVHISQLAVEKLPPGALRTLLEDPVSVPTLEAGSMFPDGGYAVGDDYGENAHWSPFLNAYITYLRNKYAGDYSSTAAKEEVAFLMGIASHGIADQTYDTTILARAFEVDGDPGSVDQEADYFIIVDQNVLIDTQAWAPYSDLVTVFFDGIGYSVSEATMIAGTTALEAAIALQKATALQQYHAAWQHYPWLGTHVYNEEAPGSLPHLAELVQRHWQVVWQRLQFNDDFDQDAVIGFVPEQWQDVFPADTSGGAANFRIGVLFGYGVSRAQAAPFIDLLDESSNSVPFSLQTPYNGDIRNYMWLVPTSPLQDDHEYRVVISAGIENRNGSATTVDHTLTFRTRCATPGPGCADVPPPLVTGETPFTSECGVADGRDRLCKQVITDGKSRLKIKDDADDSKDSLNFRWLGGENTIPLDFGNPFAITSHSLCVWGGAEESTMEKLYESTIPPGGQCAGKPCWKSIDQGYRFNDATGTNRGLNRLLVKGGIDEKARLLTRGKGAGLDLPALPLVPAGGTARVQIRNEATCWEANLAASISKSDASTFVATADAADVGPQPPPDPTPDARCRAAKERAAGKYARCLATVRSKEVKTGSPRDASQCVSRIESAFAKAESKAVGTCPTTGDSSDAIATVDGCIDTITTAILNGIAPPGTGGAAASCDSRKTKAAGKYIKCMMRARAKASKRGVFVDPTDTAKCESKLIASIEANNGDHPAPPCSALDDALSILASANACPLDFSGNTAQTESFGMICDLGIASIQIPMDLTVAPLDSYEAGVQQATDTQIVVEIDESLVGTLLTLGAMIIQLDSADAVTTVAGATGGPINNSVDGTPILLDLTVDTDIPPNGTPGPVIIATNTVSADITPDIAATSVVFDLDTVSVEMSMVPVLGTLSLSCTQDPAAGNQPISFAVQ